MPWSITFFSACNCSTIGTDSRMLLGLKVLSPKSATYRSGLDREATGHNYDLSINNNLVRPISHLKATHIADNLQSLISMCLQCYPIPQYSDIFVRTIRSISPRILKNKVHAFGSEIKPMNLKEVNVISPQPLQTLLNTCSDVFLIHTKRLPPNVRRPFWIPAYFCCHYDLPFKIVVVNTLRYSNTRLKLQSYVCLVGINSMLM